MHHLDPAALASRSRLVRGGDCWLRLHALGILDYRHAEKMGAGRGREFTVGKAPNIFKSVGGVTVGSSLSYKTLSHYGNIPAKQPARVTPIRTGVGMQS